MDDRRARFDELYREHAGAVAAYALRRAPRDVAEEVVAETFLVAWRRLERVPAKPLPWLYGVARRTLANQRRAAKRRDALARRLELEVPPVTGEQIEYRVLDALQTLRSKDRELLMLVAWEGLTPGEAAVVLGSSPVACRIRLHRARKQLALAIESPSNSAALTAKEAR
jgi:RNA polymerase sigma-70 factor (ECF subfamily)